MTEYVITPFMASVLNVRRTLTFVVLCTGMAVFEPAASQVQDPQPVQEDKIKAAMIYKFLAYVNWPEHRSHSPDLPYTIVFIGRRSVYQELKAIAADINVAGTPIRVRWARNPAAINKPHLVFVSRGAERYLVSLEKLAQQQSFLIITESDNGLPPGSTINLMLVNGRMSFAASLPAAEKSGVGLNSRLLAIAHQVHRSGP